MTIYTPDRWVVVELTHNTIEKQSVLAGWSGGYLSSDDWRLSSAIDSVAEYDDRYEFDNKSGSRYICYKTRHGFTGLTANVFEGFKNEVTTCRIVQKFIGINNEEN